LVCSVAVGPALFAEFESRGFVFVVFGIFVVFIVSAVFAVFVMFVVVIFFGNILR
jgi:hypothetical protein